MLQIRPTWPGPKKAPPAKVEEMEVKDANPPWTARERTVVAQMERHVEKSERIQVGISGLEHFLLELDDETRVCSLAEYARDEGGHSRFAVIETSRGIEVANVARAADGAQKNRISSSDLQKVSQSTRRRREADCWTLWKGGRSSEFWLKVKAQAFLFPSSLCLCVSQSRFHRFPRAPCCLWFDRCSFVVFLHRVEADDRTSGEGWRTQNRKGWMDG